MANTWLAGPNFPIDDVFHNARVGVLVGNKFYVHTSEKLYEYNILTSVWTQLASSTINQQSRGSTLVSLGAYLYTNGGLQAAPTKLARYNILTNVWDEAAPMIGIHYSSRLAVAAGKLYSFGGGPTWTGVEEYTPETNTWVAKGNAPRAKANPFTAVVGGKVHLIASNPAYGGPEHDIYNPPTDSWTSAASIVRGIDNDYYGAGAAFGKYIFTLSVSDQLWMFDTVAGTWEQKTGPAIEGSPKSFGASSTLMYAHMGVNFKIYTPDIVGGVASFFPDDGATITPAPEPLPHVITTQDTAGNIPFQRKLQENFESIQRQLMALDVDNQDSADPQR